MNRFGSFIVKRRWWLLGLWLVAAVVIVGVSPKLSSVESNDQSSFLPKSYESIKAADIAKKVTPHSQDASDLIVFKNKSGLPLNSSDLQTVNKTIRYLADAHLPHVAVVSTSPHQLSPDHKVQLAMVVYSGNPDDTPTINAVKGVRSALHSQLAGSSDLTANDTGQEAIGFDTQDASNRALKIVSTGTLLLVLILPALIFRSPFAGLLPIAAVGIVDVIASALIADAAKIFDFKVNQQLSVIFTVVLFGIGTDYILFLLFRYRERLRDGDHTKGAVSYALSHAGLAILSAALVVLASFTALFFAKFGIFSSMAPGLVICVAVMMLAALTLVPALVSIVEEKVFWPSKAWKSKSLNPTISKNIGGLIARRPVLVAASVTLILVLLGVLAHQYKPDFSSFSNPPKGTESAAGYSDLLAAFPAGETSPVQVYISSDNKLTAIQLAAFHKKVAAAPGVAIALPVTVAPNGKVASVDAILKDNPYSNEAITNAGGPIRDTVHSLNGQRVNVYVGGLSSVFADVKSVSNRDLKVIFPIAAVFIFIILMVLLRSLVAPVLLLLCVSLGYAATLGATTLIFQQIGNAAGLIFFIPLFMYIFVVAIGTDYNILTITRLREEVKEGNGPREAADLTVEHSSATVISAGLILAATFGSLLLADLNFLSQMGTAIAIGVMISAFVIAPFLIPSISAILGYKIWWPGNRATRLKNPKKHNKSSLKQD